MKPIRTFSIVPVLPPELHRLRDIAVNLRWSWDGPSRNLFARLDPDLWESTHQNPVRLLGAIDQSRLEEAAADEGFRLQLERVAADFDAYMGATSTWYARTHGQTLQPCIAYFSPEFGVANCLNIFAGGLGLLAGDHLKSASDLGVPLVGISLLYQQGYFRQTLNDAGWQQEFSEENDFHNLPLTLVHDSTGGPLTVRVPHPGREVSAQVWLARVGRVQLYLLDTNIPENLPEDRGITDQLYGGDLEMRIRQEVVLGIGGCRALVALGLEPTVYHMNEGHSAFLALERARALMSAHGLTFEEAREAASAGTIFTTHTPVPAGHDAFPSELIDRYLTEYAAEFGLERANLLALGRINPTDEGELFGMTILALKMSAYTNGVSELHGKVSRDMWQALWPGVPVNEVPIGHVTNGIHLASWVSEEMASYYDRYIGPRWRSEPTGKEIWAQAGQIPPEELWRIHERHREEMVLNIRETLQAQLDQHGAAQAEIKRAGEVLDPEILTIGFARRFATYKRATLLLRDIDRFIALINNATRPIQIIFAGKAHPRDDAGKELIRQIVVASRRAELRHRVVFLEDYDIAIARRLVQGVDVWLNNPRRPMEASGTSGMKASANANLNFSTLDGWWDEAWREHSGTADPAGWAIGRGETYSNWDLQDQVEAEDIYDVLERDIIPTFYDRGADNLPRRWIARMAAAIECLCPFVSGLRMVRDYTEQFYLPALAMAETMAADDMNGARDLAIWRARVTDGWKEVRVEAVNGDARSTLEVGSALHTQALVHLGALRPEDVTVELYAGRVNAAGELVDPTSSPMVVQSSAAAGGYIYQLSAPMARSSGIHGYTVRVLPRHDCLCSPYVPGLITWAEAPDGA